MWTNLYVDKHEPAEAPRIPYAIDNQRIASMPSPTHVPFGVWRAVDHSQHAFFTESFIDELAMLAARDPYRFRRDLLAHKPRHRNVLDAAANAAGWGNELGPGRGRGIALHESFGSIVAEVVEARVDAGNVRVERVVCAIDPGYAVNPDGLTAQMESGIVYGLTAALYGEISLGQGRVKQSNFHDYPMLRIDEMPQVDTVIVESGGPSGRRGRTRHATPRARSRERHPRRHRCANTGVAGLEARPQRLNESQGLSNASCGQRNSKPACSAGRLSRSSRSPMW